MNLGKLTVEQLIAKWEETRLDLANSLLDACMILVELRKRGRSRSEWRTGVFQWADQIARGDLDPHAALTMFDSPYLIHNIMGLPLDEQRRLAQGGEITTAVLRSDGTVVAESLSIASMQPSVFARVIDRGVVRSFEDQKRMLLDRQQTTRAHRSPTLTIRVDRAKQEIIVGEVRLTVLEVSSALRELGFKVERIEREKTAA